MIQEILFGESSSTTTSSAYSGHGERKAVVNNNGGIIAEAMTAAATKNPSDNSSNDGNKSNLEQNLRCPRCDSSNTKFCYYNNYNLTQPRHFCKTCRRYWTKGGALRNVPIGGGCRKNKTSFNSTMPAHTASKSFTGKSKAAYSSSAEILLKAGLGNIGLLDYPHQESSVHHHHHPIMWSSPPQPQTSHLLEFLRSTQNPNPSNQSHLISSSPPQSSEQGAVGFTPLNLLNGQTPFPESDYPCSSFLRNSSNYQTLTQHQQVAQQQLGGVVQNSGIQELYQRLKLQSTNSGGNENSHAHVLLVNGNGVSASSSPTSTRTTVESAPVTVVGGSDSGLWNIPAAYSTWTLPPAANGDGCSNY